jgi:hypothetical protein
MKLPSPLSLHALTTAATNIAAALLITAFTLADAARAQNPEAAQPQASPQPASADKVQPTDQKERAGRGKFVSFKNGTLTLKGNYAVLVWNGITEKTQVHRWDDAAGVYQPAGSAEVLSKLEPGAWVMVGDGKSMIRVGSRKGKTTGTFVSFKDERLLLLGINLGGSYVKKYGNQVHFHKFATDVPVYESIDGGDFTLAGTPATTLPKVREGTILTVYGEGDDNIVRIEIGAPKKK